MQGVQSNGGGYSIPVDVDGGLMEQTGGSELSHSGRSIAAVCPSSLQPGVPPPRYSELFPVSLPSYREAVGEGRDPGSPQALPHRRVECLNDALCRCSWEGLARNWQLMLLMPPLCILLCVIIVVLVKIDTLPES